MADLLYPAYFGGTINGTATIWGNWTSSTTGTSSNGTVWSNWLCSGTSTAATTTTLIWNGWTNQAWVDTRTPEEIAAAEDAARVARAQAEERAAREHAESAQAVARAETLLHEHLRPGQRRMLRDRKHFYLRSQHGRRYEIERGHHANVYEVDGSGKRLQRFCIYARGNVPEADCMLAQKLHLEMNEDHFRQVAHASRVNEF